MVKVFRPLNSGAVSGKMGDIVFVKQGNNTIIRSAQKPYPMPVTPALTTARNKWADTSYLYQIMRRLTCRINGTRQTPAEIFTATASPNMHPFAEWQKRAQSSAGVIIINRAATLAALTALQRGQFTAIAAADNILGYNITPRFYNTDNDPAAWVLAICELCTQDTNDRLPAAIDSRNFFPNGVLPPAPVDPNAPPVYTPFLRVGWIDQAAIINAVPVENGGVVIQTEGVSRDGNGRIFFADGIPEMELSYNTENESGIKILSMDMLIRTRIAERADYAPTLAYLGLSNGNFLRAVAEETANSSGMAIISIMGTGQAANNPSAIIQRALAAVMRITIIYTKNGNDRTMKLFWQQGAASGIVGPQAYTQAADDGRFYIGNQNSADARNRITARISNITAMTANKLPSDEIIQSRTTADWRLAAGL